MPPKKKVVSEKLSIDDQYREKIRLASRIGKKGYTIPKSILEEPEYNFLKRDLFVQAIIKSAVGVNTDAPAFPVYRENDAKIYIPRFYGIERYGIPDKSDLQSGDPISVPFAKELRDYQNDIVDTYIKHVSNGSCGGSSGSCGGGILEVFCGAGKTVLSLKIISMIGLKTLILVHKEFLMNQWIERIEEFLPTARVGKIQGPTFDIEDKDIVIGMIQTMFCREFPVGTFDSFGLTIIDEVHRIGSEEFSKTLLKTITPYMLGISATVDRKDGLTKILHMFIGPKIYSSKRKDEDSVCVRGIEYISKDDEFNETETDFRGNVKYSTMITKICDYGPRSDFILRILRDLLLENPKCQIMVLAHNRSLLNYLYDGINHRAFATTGYYIGGMKESALKDTETKQIVLATYAMAAEALDIKTLCVLVMVTPKTDIEQSVGRILRSKHANPIVVDIIDKHDTFQNQWRKRKTFYRKSNYRIIQTNSLEYKGFDNIDKWKSVFVPKRAADVESSSDGEDDVYVPPTKGCILNTSLFSSSLLSP